MTSTDSTQTVKFMFDPACPWAWRTSLWIREVCKVRPVAVEWDLLSLEYVNRENTDDEYTALLRKSRTALKTLALAKRNDGNEAIDDLYMALGKARHDRGEELDDPQTITAALQEAKLDESLLSQAQDEPGLDEELQERYKEAEATGAFGVPTLYFNEDDVPYFGPVVDPVPRGEQAAQLWDHLLGIGEQPYFYELKRPRK